MALKAKDINNATDMRNYVEGCLNDLVEGLSTVEETMVYMKEYTHRVIDLASASQKPDTSDDALHIDNVVGQSEQFYCYDSSKDGGYKPKCDGQCDYCRRICPKQ